MPKPIRVIFAAAAMLLLFPACLSRTPARPIDRGLADRVLMIAVSGVDFKDLSALGDGAIADLVVRGAIGNVAVRISNRPADAYATLGAGERMQVPPTSGWAFDHDERIENGSAADMYRRSTGHEPGVSSTVVVIDQIARANEGKGFGGELGALSRLLAAKGRSAAALGNADHASGPLPHVLPDHMVMTSSDPPETGIHREIALVVADERGLLDGALSRDLLMTDRAAPYGVRTDPEKLVGVFKGIWDRSALVAVETGDTARADSASARMDPQAARAMRLQALQRANDLVERLVAEVDLGSTLVVLIAPTGPGGAEARGQLRPVIFSGPGVPRGVLLSDSTRRPGIVTMPDVTASIGWAIGSSGERLGSGRALSVLDENDVQGLIDRNEAAKLNDRLRTPIAGLFLASIAAVLLFRRRGKSVRWLAGAAISIPLASYTAKLLPPGSSIAIAFVAVLAVAVAISSASIFVRSRWQPASLILAATACFYILDLAFGSHSQLDSPLGYTSVAAGRYYGLGNLGFAVFAPSALIAASTLAGPGTPRRKVAASIAALVALLATGLPGLGDDIGGTIALTVSVAAFLSVVWKGEVLGRRQLPLVLLSGVLLMIALGMLDLIRPASQRTHLGDLFAQALSDPMQVWLIIRRKALLLVKVGFTNLWAASILPASALMVLSGRAGPATRRTLVSKAARASVLPAVVLGSALNDSGLAIGGVMLAILALWETAASGPSTVAEEEGVDLR